MTSDGSDQVEREDVNNSESSHGGKLISNRRFRASTRPRLSRIRRSTRFTTSRPIINKSNDQRIKPANDQPHDIQSIQLSADELKNSQNVPIIENTAHTQSITRCNGQGPVSETVSPLLDIEGENSSSTNHSMEEDFDWYADVVEEDSMLDSEIPEEGISAFQSAMHWLEGVFRYIGLVLLVVYIVRFSFGMKRIYIGECSLDALLLLSCIFTLSLPISTALVRVFSIVFRKSVSSEIERLVSPTYRWCVVLLWFSFTLKFLEVVRKDLLPAHFHIRAFLLSGLCASALYSLVGVCIVAFHEAFVRRSFAAQLSDAELSEKVAAGLKLFVDEESMVESMSGSVNGCNCLFPLCNREVDRNAITRVISPIRDSSGLQNRAVGGDNNSENRLELDDSTRVNDQNPQNHPLSGNYAGINTNNDENPLARRNNNIVMNRNQSNGQMLTPMTNNQPYLVFKPPQIESTREAMRIAASVWANTAGPSNALSFAQFATAFTDARLAVRAFGLLEPGADRTVSKSGLRDAILRLYFSRRHVDRTLRIAKSFTAALGRIAALGVSVIVAIITLVLFGVPLKELFAVALSSALLLNFVASGMAADMYYNTMLLISHPFDIGDEVTIGGEELRVHRMGLASTAFLATNGGCIKKMNSELWKTGLVNMTRAPLKLLVFRLSLPKFLDDISISYLKIRIQQYLKNRPYDFYETFSVEAVSADHTDIDITDCNLVLRAKSFQSKSRKFLLRLEINLFLNELIGEILRHKEIQDREDSEDEISE